VLLDEIDVSYLCLVAPEIGTAKIAEGKPEAGVHGVVVGPIETFPRGMSTSDLDAAGRVEVLEIRPEDLRVIVNVRGQRPVVCADDKSVGLMLERNCLCRSARRSED